ncbi:MAG: nucleotidyl transferase AbiEii/AbiGii toxin family protein, partial [Pirellulaceae bacterium]|nr:nucleotidyl transferase AbiEii/AbiGii toxin family protein [Pirellulaceae bacterium]
FSEDVDLSLNREDLGFVQEKNPGQAPSRKKAQQLIAELSETCKRVIRHELLPSIEQSLTDIMGEPSDAWSLAIDKDDPQTVLFKYPRGEFGSSADAAYVQPAVRLELGARSDHWPAENHAVQPYAAEEFPALFDTPQANVRTLAAERTFWEKATILHALHHRPTEKSFQARLSRHYYDLAQLIDSSIGETAITQVDLLATVVAHKQVFFASGWASYDTAVPGTLRLLPPPERQGEIASDYAAMREMMFDEPPSLDDVFQILSVAEERING